MEFIRTLQDPLSEWLSPTVAATNLLQMLARYRKQDTLPVFLPYLQSILMEYQSLPVNQRQEVHYVKKDGALVALSALVKVSSYVCSM